MTDIEVMAFRSLQDRLRTLSCQVSTLLCRCRTADGVVMSDERSLRKGVSRGMADLMQWNKDNSRVVNYGDSVPKSPAGGSG